MNGTTMEQLMRSLSAFAAFILVSVISGCFSTYTGIYWLDHAAGREEIDTEALRRSVATAIDGLGFAPVADGSGTSFIHDGVVPTATSAHLDGADARITIGIAAKPPTITIRDLKNTRETEFVRTLKSRIESQLRADLGISDARFERQRDIF
jgi:hypothetical protein